MMYRKYLLGFTCCFVYCAFAFANKTNIIPSYLTSLPHGVNVEFIAQKIGDNSPLINYQSNKLSLPASTQKIITALAALLELGSNYRFITSFESNAAIHNEHLEGDLTIRFSGDPALTRQQLQAMIIQLKELGITTINGNIIIDTSIFASHDIAPGLSWNDLTKCFSVPSSAAIIDHNCFSAILENDKNAPAKTSLLISAEFPIQITNKAVGIKDTSTLSDQFCDLDITYNGLNHYTLTGCLLNKYSPLKLSVAVQEGAEYSRNILADEFAKAGIKIKGKWIKNDIPIHNTKADILVAHQSVPLHILLTAMLKQSDNLIADEIFRTLGYVYFKVPGTWRSGEEAVRKILAEKANIDLKNSVLADGGGLSRYNLISAKTMMDILQYIAKHDNSLNMIKMLPISGEDGTLRYRKGVSHPALIGNVVAKTGALQGVYNLAGFITTKQGNKIAFVQFISGYSVTPTSDKTERQLPLSNFEHKLYQYIYTHY